MSSPAYLPALTGLRGLCAVWVFLYHSGPYLGSYGIPGAGLGWFGVDIFFLLSGFVIALVYLRDCERLHMRSYARFLFLRLSRIYPLHLVTLFAVLLYVLAIEMLGAGALESRGYTPHLFAANLALIQAWGWADGTSWNVPAWSLSAEWAAYLAFPLLAPLVLRVRSAWACTAAATAGLGITIGGLMWLGLDRPHTTHDYGLIRIAGSFAAGVFLCRLHVSGHANGQPWGRLTDAAAVALPVVLFVFGGFAALPVAAVLVLGLARGDGAAARVLSTPGAVYLGEVSFALYMVHMLCLDVAFAPLKYSAQHDYEGPMRIGVWLAAALLTGLATVMAYHRVELPSRRALRRAIDGRMAQQRV